MMEPYDYRLILAYDGWKIQYLWDLLKVCSPDIIVENHRRLHPRGTTLNKAISRTKPDHLKLFIEEDFYWVSPCLELAMETLLRVDFVMLHNRPIGNRQWKEKTERVWYFKDDALWKWNLHPSLSLNFLPAGPLPAFDRGLEMIYAVMCKKANFKSAALAEEHVMHFGLLNAGNKLVKQHFQHLGLPLNSSKENVLRMFESVASRKEHVQLYKEYLSNEIVRNDNVQG
jgi:hypothetical protein